MPTEEEVRMRLGILVLVVTVFAFPALASQPGHPLDCSDWVFLEPGLQCTVYSALNAVPNDSPVFLRGSNEVADNTGSLFYITSSGGAYDLGRTEIHRVSGAADTVIAYIDDRAGAPNGDFDQVRPRSEVCCPPGEQHGVLHFDAVGGRLLVPLSDSCLPGGQGHCQQYPPAGCNCLPSWIAALTGFSPLFEILQTYTPTADALQFRVPAHPEGLRSSDYFDTYWGHVSDLPDFTQAQPMMCHYPATTPVAGDYLTVADTSPAPTPGAANYTVTEVTSGTQRRYGRKLINGVMSGRDPALLAGCP